MSFEAMLGREMSDGELTNLLANGRIRVEDSMPTQRAKEFAATIMQQNMDRVSKYDAIAEENQLDRDKFTEAKDQADKEWNRLNLNIAQEFGLNDNDFRNSMWDLDQRLTDIFFKEDLTEGERVQLREDAVNSVINRFTEKYPESQGAFLQAMDQYNALWGDKQRAIAMQFGLEADQFDRANKQADQQEERSASVWASVFNEGSIRDYSSEETADKTNDSTWLMESRRWASDNPQFTTFRNDINDWAKDLGFHLGELNIRPPGDPSIGPGIYTPGSLVSEIWQTASTSQKDQLYSIFQDFADGKLMNDVILQENLEGYFNSALTPDGDHKADGKIAGEPARATVARPYFKLKAIDRDWFTDLEPNEQNAIMQLIGGSNMAPERSEGTGGWGNFLKNIGNTIGTTVAYYGVRSRFNTDDDIVEDEGIN
jgi:hypothetical protein